MTKKTDAEAIGLRIKELREKNSETQKELANALSCNQNNISKIEKGGSLTYDNLILIANHYNVSLDYLCKGEGGIDLLDTLNKFIHFEYKKFAEPDKPNKTRLFPHIKINTLLYKCMKQISLAENSVDMPESIKQQWIKQTIEDFNKEKNSDNYKDFIGFIPLEETIIEKNCEFDKLIEKHIVE